MTELINNEKIGELVKLIEDSSKQLNTEDAIELYTFFDTIIYSVNEIKQELNMKLWSGYVRYNPEINELEYTGRILKEFMKTYQEEETWL